MISFQSLQMTKTTQKVTYWLFKNQTGQKECFSGERFRSRVLAPKKPSAIKLNCLRKGQQKTTWRKKNFSNGIKSLFISKLSDFYGLPNNGSQEHFGWIGRWESFEFSYFLFSHRLPNKSVRAHSMKINLSVCNIMLMIYGK